MNRNNPTPASSSRLKQIWLRLQRFAASRVGKLAACLILVVAATLSQSARAQTPPPPGSFGAYALSNNPVAYWQLDETAAPNSGTLLAHDYTGHALNGTYGTDTYNGFDGITAPPNPPYTGFAVNQGAVLTSAGDPNAVISLPALNLNTNTVTICMWINPSGGQVNYTGLLMNRNSGGSGDAAGFGFGANPDGNGMPSLGYTWNQNNGNTYNFNSTLHPQIGTWSFVALVITPTSATIYLDYLDPNNANNPVLLSAVNTVAHTVEAFSTGGFYLGSDSAQNGAAPNNEFGGYISDAAVYNKALTSAQILQLFGAGIGVQGFKPSITTQPVTGYVLAGAQAQVSATGINGTTPFSYQWQLNNTNISGLADAANFTGATNNVLTILNVSTNDAGVYHLIVTNIVGMTVSSNATISIKTPSLVGQWLTNGTLSDVSGYSLAPNHTAMIVGTGGAVFTNDVPPFKPGQSMIFIDGSTGLAISNSSTLDANYDNTFDDQINSSMSVCVWSKGWPTTWNPWVSKDGDFVTYPNFATTYGWEIRSFGSGPYGCFSWRDLNVGLPAGDDMGVPSDPTQDGDWHFYVGTFDGATGKRSMYVDGFLQAQNTNDVPCISAAIEHLGIGVRDQPPGGSYTSYSTNLEIYDVRIYNYALTAAQVTTIYGSVPAKVTGQPKNTTAFPNTAATFKTTVQGTAPIAYQWTLNGTNVNLLPDSANFTGATNSTTLTIISATTNDVGTYQLTVTNLYGHASSSNVTLAIVQRVLVGEWFEGNTNLSELSGYRPAGTHDGYAVGNGTGYTWSSDVPTGKTGYSLYLNAGNTAIAISNSASSDVGYTNTFDDIIQGSETVAFWAKGWPAGWNYFISKNGDSGSPNAGWTVRNDGNNNVSPCFTMRSPGGTGVSGPGFTTTTVYGNSDDMAATGLTYGNDGKWHAYVATYNSGTGIRALYVDGNLAAEETGNGQYNLARYSHLVFGGFEASPGGTFSAFNNIRFYDVRIYNNDLSSNQAAAYSALPNPAITGVSGGTSLYLGEALQLTAGEIGGAPLTNQWSFNGTNLVDGTQADGSVVRGSQTAALKIYNVGMNEQGGYKLVLSNTNGVWPGNTNNVTIVGNTVAPPAGNLVGQWLAGTASFADTSGYSPAGTHDGSAVKGANVASTAYVFTNDVPPSKTNGVSLYLNNGNTTIAISNSATGDLGYVNTYDDVLTNAFTVTCWAKGLPGAWNPWVSKYGEGPGWQLRVNGGATTPCWTIRNTNNADMSSTIGSVDATSWHFYAGTYDSASGIRNLYVDGVLAAQQTSEGPYNLAPVEHLAIGGKDSPSGNNFGNYFTGEMYDVRIYNTALSAAQVNNFLLLPVPAAVTPPPTFGGPPVITTGPSGKQLVLTWSVGSLLSATNVTGPWTPTGATSPYTNVVSGAPKMFFRLSNP